MQYLAQDRIDPLSIPEGYNSWDIVFYSEKGKNTYHRLPWTCKGIPSDRDIKAFCRNFSPDLQGKHYSLEYLAPHSKYPY